MWAAPHDGRPHAPSTVLMVFGLILFLGGPAFWVRASSAEARTSVEQATRWHRTMTFVRWSGRVGRILAVVSIPVVATGGHLVGLAVTSAPRRGLFDPTVNEHRCTSVSSGRRCQLWTGHDPQHAAAWSEPKPITSYRRGSGVIARRHWLRWNDAGVTREQEPGSERLPWACMGST